MTVTNPFVRETLLSGVGTDVAEITPSDSVVFSVIPFSLRVATAGTLRGLTVKGNDRTITVLAGERITCGYTRIYATGTTATGIIGYYL